MNETTSKEFAERPTGAISDVLREHLHVRQNICTELELLPEKTEIDYAAELSRLCADFANAPAVPPEFDELLNKRFADALNKAREGEKRFQERCVAAEKLQQDLQALLAAGELATLNEIEALERRHSELFTEIKNDDFAISLIPLKERLCAENEKVSLHAQQVSALAEELKNLTEAEDITPLHDRKPEIEKQFAEIGQAPRAAVAKYQDALRKASLRLAQHYATLDLARWESYTLKLDICNELEKLNQLSTPELGKVAKTLNELRDKWKHLGSVPKEKNEEINPRFLELTRLLQHRIDEYFSGKRQEQKLSEAAKIKLCEEAEGLTDSTNWVPTAERFKAMQQEWKNLPRAGNAEKNLFTRFRAAADKFFAARKVILDERDRRYKAIISKKQVLIAEAQNLTDIHRARTLREEFRNIGSAGRAETGLFKEFNTALDKFFANLRDEVAAKEIRAKKLIAEIDALACNPLTGIERIEEIRKELQELACRNTRSIEKNALNNFETALTSARFDEQCHKLSLSRNVALSLAEAYDNFKAGNNVKLPDAALFSAFNRLATARQWLQGAIDGESKATEKLERQISSARIERERICSELEKLTGNRRTVETHLSLADELQAAIMGNFAKTEAKAAMPVVDPEQLCSEFMECGLVPAAEMNCFFDRFDEARAKLNL